MDIQQVHEDLLTDLNDADPGGNKPWTAFPWVLLANMSDGFPRFFVEPPSITEAPDHETLRNQGVAITWNVYYVNRYENVTGDTNPFQDVMAIIQAILDRYAEPQQARTWTTAIQLHYTSVAVLADNSVNSWARDLKQPVAAVQFIIQAVGKST